MSQANDTLRVLHVIFFYLRNRVTDVFLFLFFRLLNKQSTSIVKIFKENIETVPVVTEKIYT